MSTHEAENVELHPSSVAQTSCASPARILPPRWERAWDRAGRQIERGALIQAIATTKLARKQGADPYQCLLRIADLHHTIGHYTQALEALEQAVALDPSRLAGWEQLLMVAQTAGVRERAISVSHILIKLVPNHIDAHSMLGAAYMLQGDVEAALRVSNTLIRLDPETPAHHFRKALLCQHQNEVALAVDEFLHTLRLDPDGPLADPARDALENLDLFQLNNIITLALEDAVFRAQLMRDPVGAAEDRGFALSPMGIHLLTDFCDQALPECPANPRPSRYH